MQKIRCKLLAALTGVICVASAQAAVPDQSAFQKELTGKLARQAYAARPENTESSSQNFRESLAQYRPWLLKRFLTYVSYDRQSDEKQAITQEEIETAQKLYAELETMGVPVTLTEHYYLFAEFPSNLDYEVPVLGYSAHYDVAPDIEGKNIQARVIENYDGEPIVLENNQVIDPKKDNGKYLPTQVGKTIVTSDGNTLLGADDGAGLAVLMTFMQTLVENPDRPHGKIQIILAPNEDIGRAHWHVEETPYQPEIAFDFDGGNNGRIIVKNFYARQETITVNGVPGHQSYAATNGYRNAWVPACKLSNAICKRKDQPNYSEGDEGYKELNNMKPKDEKPSVAKIDVRLRGFSTKPMDKWERKADKKAKKIAKKYKVEITRESEASYNNVSDTAHPQALPITKAAAENAGVKINIETARAGTTAGMFSTKGIVGGYTVFTGQNNPHNYTEWLSEEDMYYSYLLSISLMDEVAKQKAQ